MEIFTLATSGSRGLFCTRNKQSILHVTLHFTPRPNTLHQSLTISSVYAHCAPSRSLPPPSISLFLFRGFSETRANLHLPAGIQLVFTRKAFPDITRATSRTGRYRTYTCLSTRSGSRATAKTRSPRAVTTISMCCPRTRCDVLPLDALPEHSTRGDECRFAPGRAIGIIRH